VSGVPPRVEGRSVAKSDPTARETISSVPDKIRNVGRNVAPTAPGGRLNRVHESGLGVRLGVLVIGVGDAVMVY
jgi:hypothetical protein